MTMNLELRFFATFREAVGQKTVHQEFAADARVGDVLAALESEYDGLDGQLIDDGDLREHLSVLRNGRDVVHLNGLDTPLSDGDALSVFPPVAGGGPGNEEVDGSEDVQPDLPDDVLPPGWQGETIFWTGAK